MKKNIYLVLLLVLTSILFVTSCSKKENKFANNTKNEIENEVEDVEKEDEKEDTLFYYEGEQNGYRAEISVTNFTEEEKERVKEEIGEDSDIYKFLDKNSPSQVINTKVVYSGEEILNFDKVKELHVSVSPFDYNKVYPSNQDATMFLQGKDNPTDFIYFFASNQDVSFDENTKPIIEIKSNDNIINTSIELKNIK